MIDLSNQHETIMRMLSTRNICWERLACGQIPPTLDRCNHGGGFALCTHKSSQRRDIFSIYCHHCSQQIDSQLPRSIQNYVSNSTPRVRHIDMMTVRKFIQIARNRQYWKNREDRKTNYDSYLNSQEWFNRRKERLGLDRYTCVICKSRATQVHHLSYANIFNEPMSDLQSVCKPCHKRLHRIKSRLTRHGG